jgi:hypothetical protein
LRLRGSDWGHEIIKRTIPELVVRTAAANLDGIWLGLRAYADNGATLMSDLRTALADK